MAENNEMYAEDFEDRVRTIGVLTSGGDAPGNECCDPCSCPYSSF